MQGKLMNSCRRSGLGQLRHTRVKCETAEENRNKHSCVNFRAPWDGWLPGTRTLLLRPVEEGVLKDPSACPAEGPVSEADGCDHHAVQRAHGTHRRHHHGNHHLERNNGGPFLVSPLL